MLPSISDVRTSALRLLLGTRCFAKVLAAGGTAPAKVKTTNAAQYCIDGRAYTKAATDDFWTLAGVAIPASSIGYFLLCMDAAGAAVVVQGAIVDAATGTVFASTSPVKKGDGFHGALPATNGIPTACPIAEVKVTTNGTGTFVPGTTSLAVAGTVAATTYSDLSTIPEGGKGA
jgi:hypothetical protein